MDENFVVTQSNKLIEARHMKPLSAREQKIVLTMVSMIQLGDEDFKEYSISIKEFSEMLGLKGHAKYEEIKEVALHLQEKTIFIPNEDGFVTTNWVAGQVYKKGEGVIKLSFSPYLKPYLLQLKSQFTSYKLSNILSLGSGYSIRLYELMKKWQHLGKWEYPVDELKLKFGISGDTYTQYNHFKTRVLKRAVEELNEKTDLHISYKEIKNGRKIDKIEFTIKHSADKEIKLPTSPKEPEKKIENEEVRERLNTLAVNYSFDQTYFAQMYQGASLIWNNDVEKELKMLISYVNEEETIKNPLGFIKSKIKQAWDFQQDGVSITFADLKSTKRKTGRTEVVPDWFNERKKAKDEIVATVDTEVDQEKKRKLFESLGKSPEEIEELMKIE
ncbi:replication initiation protein [Psychrobacillus sp. FSL K6-1415]|uniref:replication initiation protein n=1 Tax=Psychrobacillus sp. FSL K6-1415 TaxID=2921544 RepID=UPI0030F771B3